MKMRKRRMDYKKLYKFNLGHSKARIVELWTYKTWLGKNEQFRKGFKLRGGTFYYVTRK